MRDEEMYERQYNGDIGSESESERETELAKLQPSINKQLVEMIQVESVVIVSCINIYVQCFAVDFSSLSSSSL